MPRKPTLSPTKIATYLECAVKYRYIYIDKIGRFFSRAKPYYSLGATMHQALEQYHRDGGVQSQAELVETFEQRWISAGFQSPEEELVSRAAGAEMVQAYHSAAALRTELEVATLFTEKTIKTDLGPFVLTGRVDRIDRYADGSLEIVDYKSGRMETTPEEVAGDLAMSIYQLILRRTYPGTRVIGTIYCLRTGVQASAEMSDESAGEFKTDVQILGEEILARDYENVEPVRIPACEYCDFLTKCERFWRAEARRDMRDG